jgi:hypothetical protein
MSPTAPAVRVRCPRRAIALAVALAAITPPAAPADEKPGGAPAKCASPEGTLLARRPGEKAWHAVRPQESVTGGELLLALPGARAAVESGDRAVRLTLWGNVPVLSSFPVLESAVRLSTASSADLEFTLDRGRVVVTGIREKPAEVRVHHLDQDWGLSLENGSQVCLELYSRWPPGTTFSPTPRPEAVPVSALVVWVLKGQVDLKVGSEQYSLRAPPGPAFFHWSSEQGRDTGPKRRDRLPSWAEPDAGNSPEAKAVHEAVVAQRRQLAEKPVDEVLGEELNNGDAVRRELAVYGLAAVDDLPRLADALADPRHADVRETAAEALRHWLGRSAGQDAVLYRFLTRERQYTPGQAEILIQLLFGFAEADRTRPETYETLIAYLRHGKLPIRELAREYLYQWVPAGKKIPYDPAGPEEERDRAQAAWKKLVPHGELPPRPRRNDR